MQIALVTSGSRGDVQPCLALGSGLQQEAEKHGIPALGVYNVPITPTYAYHNLSFPAAAQWLPFKGS